jgi:hypothetical protein
VLILAFRCLLSGHQVPVVSGVDLVDSGQPLLSMLVQENMHRRAPGHRAALRKFLERALVDPSDALGQEHQVGRFLSIFEERLARRTDLRAHG